MIFMQKRDRLIPWYFVAFFVVLAIIDGIMVTIAIRTQTGTVTKHPYEQGLNYNQIINASEKQNTLGWNGDINFHSTSNKTGNLKFILKDKSGTIFEPENVSATITRPTQSGMDFEIKLIHDESGIFLSDINFPLTGLWEIRIFVKDHNNTYQKSKRVVVE